MTNPYFSSYTPLPRNQTARAEALNAIFDAIVIGFNGVPDVTEFSQGRATYSTDSGTANAYVLTPPTAIASYIAGQTFTFAAAHANTTASTVNVSALGVVAIKRPDGNDLASGDITSGRLVTVTYDGTHFQMTTPAGSDVVNSAASATAAASSATAAAASATSAASSASSASTSATAASSSAASASSSASSASTSATNASTSATNAANSATAAAASVAPITFASGKTLTINKTLTFTGTDSTTMTFPSTSATIARTDAANTFTGHQTIEGVTSTGATGTGKLVFDTAPTLTTPALGTPASGVLTNCTGLPAAGLASTAGTGTAVALETDGTWTPADGSGASLTFTNVKGNYRRVGNIVFIDGEVDYPATADASNASISLPVTPAATLGPRPGVNILTAAGAVLIGQVSPSIAAFVLYNAKDTTLIPNNFLQNTTLFFSGWYRSN